MVETVWEDSEDEMLGNTNLGTCGWVTRGGSFSLVTLIDAFDECAEGIPGSIMDTDVSSVAFPSLVEPPNLDILFEMEVGPESMASDILESSG